MSKIRGIIVIIVLITVLSGCQKEEKSVIIAKQYGLAYAPLQIMMEMGYLEETLPDYQVEWVKLANTAAIREAMLADDLDIGFMGIPPFLIGVETDMNWKIMTGLSKSPLGLVTNQPDIKTLADLKDKGKIALPQPGSIQHILLSMAAKKEFQQADYFDQQLVSMKHPDGYQALIGETEVVAHFTSPPYLFQELDADNTHLLLSGDEAFGSRFTFIVGVCQEAFYEDKEAYNAFLEALDRSILYMEEEPENTVEILAKVYELDSQTVEAYIYHTELTYEKDIEGLEVFIDFMYNEGYISGDVKGEEVIW